MNETKTTWQRFIGALPAVALAAAVVAPTTVSIGIFIAVLSLNNGLRAEMSAQSALIASVDARLAAMETDIRELKDAMNALEADVVELKLEVAQIKVRLDNIERRLSVVESRLSDVESRLAVVDSRLPDVESMDVRLGDLEREQARLSARVDALSKAVAE